MRRWRNNSLIVAVLFTTLVAAGQQKGSFHVTASTDTGFVPTGWWKVDIREDGTVSVVGDARAPSEFTIPRERVKALMEAVRGALALYPHQGTVCFDCPLCQLTVELDGQERTVYFAPFRGQDPTPAERKHAREFLGMWAAVKTAAKQESLPDPCPTSEPAPLSTAARHTVGAAAALVPISSAVSPALVPTPCSTPKHSKNDAVLIEAVIDETGRVESACVVISVSPEFDQKALESVRTQRYPPGAYEGKPAKTVLTVSVRPHYSL